MADPVGPDAGEVALTYETLYELLRREKNREELQQLDALFFAKLVGYLREKEAAYGSAGSKNDLFSIGERDRLHTELQNIRRLVKELYERREKKAIEMALNRSRTNANIVDTTNLLSEERAFFDQLVGVLDHFRHAVLGSVLALHEPLLTPAAAFSSPVNSFLANPNAPQNAQPAPASPSSASSPTSVPGTSSPGSTSPSSFVAGPHTSQASQHAATGHKSSKKVRFIQPVPQVVGPDMDEIGPFEPNDTADLPVDVADIWIEQGAAVEQLP